ncbi:MAG: M6 family metalloprotease domain-containing protein [Candidatus Syntrophosphaera sp.]|nr:M6 family metalloprotease domain-containing protein [Candidatus Syntrophosphaera sp.]
MLKFKLLSLVSFLLAICLLGAAPLANTPVRIVQPDGAELDILASGDEFHNWLHDADNYSIVQNEAGYYVYARQDGETVAPTDLVVGRDLPAQRGIQPGINLSGRLIAEKYERLAEMRDYSNARSPHTGPFNNLVVFIKFADDPDFTTPISVYDQMFNSPNSNSMRRYFDDASYGQLDVDSSFYPQPTGETILCYTDIYNRNYYRVYSPSNPEGYSGDSQRTQREHQLLLRAVNYVASMVPTDLAIDGDNDGYVDNTCFIIKGSPEGWAELLWPHRWVLYTVNAMIHGKRVWDFNFQLETSALSSGASVLSHEMFHSLGAPDLYRYNDNTITPIGIWDLMASNSNPPQHMSVWMKYNYGQWLDSVPDITSSGTYTLYPVASSASNNIYRIPAWRSGEYYVLEYRKPSANYDHTLPATGLLVYRLNTQASGNAQGPPDELYLYRPHGTNTTTNGVLNMAGFSAQCGRAEISEATVPSGFMSNNAPGGLNLFDIGVAGDSITFKIKVSEIQLTYPHGGETWFSGTSKTLAWKAKSLTGSVTLEYSSDGGSSWTNLSNSASNNGFYIWSNIPQMDSEQMHVRITQNSNGQTDSNTYPFTILSEMAVPEGTWPPDGATNIPTNPLLNWTAVPGATSYQLHVSDTPDYISYIVDELDWETNTYQLNYLEPYVTYYWRVCSMSEVGVGPFCETMSFTTGNISEIPEAPALIYPAHMATNLPIDIEFSWLAMPLAESYILHISQSPYFVDPEFAIENISGTTQLVEGLNFGTLYYWRVGSANVAGESNFSQINRFTTMYVVAGEDHLNPVLINNLEQNFPNPFNPSTTISLSLKDPAAELSVLIYNIKGQVVRNLYQGTPGKQRLNLIWDGKDDQGGFVGSGIYHYRMRSGDYVQTRKMILMK